MTFVMSSLQRPTTITARIKKRNVRPRPSLQRRAADRTHPNKAPLPTPTTISTPTTPSVLAPIKAPTAIPHATPWHIPYVSTHGLTPLQVHPRLAPEMLQTQHALDLGTPTHQHNTGRCWIFSSLNWLRQHVREAYGKDFQYSQSYIAYWDKLERANTHFHHMMAATDQTPESREMMSLHEWFVDGGNWEFFYNIVQKYGVVPNYAMPETRLAGESYRYMQLLERRVHEIGGLLHKKAQVQAPTTELAAIKAQGMQEVRNILDAYLGHPPSTFLWRDPQDDKSPWVQKKPQAFLAENPAKLDNMVFLSNYPQHAMRSRLVFDDIANVEGSPVPQSLNVPMPTLKRAIRQALRKGEPVLSLSDTVSLDQTNNLWSLATSQGPALLGLDATLTLNKGDRVRYGINGATHAMMFSGYDNAWLQKYQGEALPDPEAELLEPLWQVENSWGGEPMYMTDRWVDNFVYGIIINKAHLTPQTRRALEDPTLPTKHLPPWNPARPTLG